MFIVSSETKLHYFSTGRNASHHLSEKVLCFYERAKELLKEYQQERCTERGISDTIKTANHTNSLSSANKLKMKQQNPQITIREMDNARNMKIQLKEIPKYELITDNDLFDGDYTTKTKQKHALVNTLGKLLNINTFQFLNY